MQQPELRERIEGRRLDLDAADELSKVPYEEFLTYYFGRTTEPTPTMMQAALLRVISLHYENKGLKDKVQYMEDRLL